MPRPRKPSAVLRLVGAHKENPSRIAGREGEPVDNAPMGGPPDRLTPTEREIWREIQAQLVPGIALASDSAAFETLVQLVALERTDRTKLKGGHLSMIARLYAAFGMTPADRSRVAAVPNSAKENPFARGGREGAK